MLTDSWLWPCARALRPSHPSRLALPSVPFSRTLAALPVDFKLLARSVRTMKPTTALLPMSLTDSRRMAPVPTALAPLLVLLLRLETPTKVTREVTTEETRTSLPRAMETTRLRVTTETLTLLARPSPLRPSFCSLRPLAPSTLRSSSTERTLASLSPSARSTVSSSSP